VKASRLRLEKQSWDSKSSQPVCRSRISVLEVNVSEPASSESESISLQKIVFTKADIAQAHRHDDDDCRQMAIVSKIVKPKGEPPKKK